MITPLRSRLREFLKGHHKPTCRLGPRILWSTTPEVCTCGLDALLATLDAEETPTKEIESALAHSDIVLSSIRAALEGEPLNDFQLSIPLVRQVADLAGPVGLQKPIGNIYDLRTLEKVHDFYEFEARTVVQMDMFLHEQILRARLQRDLTPSERADLLSDVFNNQYIALSTTRAVFNTYEDAVNFMKAGPSVRTEAPQETTLRCMDCQAVYSEFPLDTTIPDEQWRLIHNNEGGVLCASCIVKRAAKLPGVVAIRARIDFGEAPAAESPAPSTEGYFDSPADYTKYLDERAREGKPAYVSQAFLRAANETAREFAEVDEAMGTPMDGTDEDAQAYRLKFIERAKLAPPRSVAAPREET